MCVLQLEGDLKEMQRKVESSKAEILRISRDLRPIEVPPTCMHSCRLLFILCTCQERKQEMDEMYGEADSTKTKIGRLK